MWVQNHPRKLILYALMPLALFLVQPSAFFLWNFEHAPNNTTYCFTLPRLSVYKILFAIRKGGAMEINHYWRRFQRLYSCSTRIIEEKTQCKCQIYRTEFAEAFEFSIVQIIKLSFLSFFLCDKDTSLTKLELYPDISGSKFNFHFQCSEGLPDLCGTFYITV